MKSAEGIAIGFISIWFLGDIFNLVGALWAGLLPEVIFLAAWFCIADFLMIASFFYYTNIYPKKHHHKKPSRASSHNSTEETHLLRRRSSTLTEIALQPQSQSVLTKFVLPIAIVIGAGCLGFFFSDSSAPRDDTPPPSISVGPQVIGYLSAVLYLGARIPQIIQNHRRRSVDGLSLLFFMFSTLGNLTYAGQILLFRSDSQYLLLNLSWLLGSLGTIFEDLIIFIQFYLYKDSRVVVDAA